MQNEIPAEVLEAIIASPGIPVQSTGELKVERLNGGLINHTYKVSNGFKPGLLLQQINKKVFVNPSVVQENYLAIWEYAVSSSAGFPIPAPNYFDENGTLFIDKKENYWRAFEFIDDTRMFTVAENPKQAKATANAFASFTAAFTDFDVRLLKTVIPGFHDLLLRYRQFEEALKQGSMERLSKANSIVEALQQRERYKNFYETIIQSAEFPLRVMHHDAKIANVLFSTKTGEVVCPVDFDTVMPGYFFSDMGDMIRSMVGSEEENSTMVDSLVIRKDFYEAILAGYMEVLGNQLTQSEKKYIHYAGLLMIYMQALRFIVDYLNGDVYYRTNYPDQNFDRAKNQLTLLQKLEDFLNKQYHFTNE